MMAMLYSQLPLSEWASAVNRLHDFLPPHRVRDCAEGRRKRDFLTAWNGRQVPRREDTRRTVQHPFARAFLSTTNRAYSFAVRYDEAAKAGGSALPSPTVLRGRITSEDAISGISMRRQAIERGQFSQC